MSDTVQEHVDLNARTGEQGASTGELITHIEALIFASDRPLTSVEITELVNNAFGFMDSRIEGGQVDTALEGIVEKYDSRFYPFEVRQSGGGWQFLTKKEFHKTVAQLNGEKFLKRLSAAALETLAIIAYKQPLTKGEIESIRGVSSDYSVQKLLEKELIVIAGRNEKLPGHPLIYSTSKGFMDYFGINTADDLPKIKEALQEQMVEPTVVHGGDEGLENTTTEETEERVEADRGAEDNRASDAAAGIGEAVSSVSSAGEEVLGTPVTGDSSMDAAGPAEGEPASLAESLEAGGGDAPRVVS